MTKGSDESTSIGGFVLPLGARHFFDYRSQRLFASVGRAEGATRDMILFDAYWACLAVGLLVRKPASEGALESDRFLSAYPDDYVPHAEYIAGLLVEAELSSLHMNTYDERQIERMIADLLKVSSPTRLSAKGMRLLNLYAAGGFDIVRDTMGLRPTDVPNFLIRFEEVLSSLRADAG